MSPLLSYNNSTREWGRLPVGDSSSSKVRVCMYAAYLAQIALWLFFCVLCAAAHWLLLYSPNVCDWIQLFTVSVPNMVMSLIEMCIICWLCVWPPSSRAANSRHNSFVVLSLACFYWLSPWLRGFNVPSLWNDARAITCSLKVLRSRPKLGSRRIFSRYDVVGWQSSAPT